MVSALLLIFTGIIMFAYYFIVVGLFGEFGVIGNIPVEYFVRVTVIFGFIVALLKAFILALVNK